MYLYDDFDQTLVAERVAEFRDQVARRLSGELTEDEFKLAAADERRLSAAARLHAADRDPLRHAVVGADAHARACRAPLRPRLRPFHHAAEHPVQLDQARRDAGRAAPISPSASMHAMQTSGNCVRNITTDQWAGVAPDEIEDPRIWAEILRQHSTLHPEFSFLPRKFKIAVTAAEHDRAAIAVHDIGLRMHPQRRGRGRFRGDGRRRARPHAVHRQDHQAVPAQARPAELRRGDPARLQPVRTARQHLQGAHQDPGARARRGKIRRRSRERMAERSRTARWRSIPR